jgi:HEAT repeat protein
VNLTPLDDLLARLHGAEAGEITRTIREIREGIPSLSEGEVRKAVEALCGLFYIDLHERGDLQPAVDAAEETIASIGEPVIPVLVRLLEDSDAKSHFYLARTLARIGPRAVPHLRRMIATSEDPYCRAFALYAVGKVKDESVHEVLPEAVGSLMHPDKEVRDSAARTLGKIVEQVEPGRLSERRRSEVYDALTRALADVQPPVRAKAVRSLGKMARRGYLDQEQAAALRTRLVALLTRGEAVDWDRAYIVRREAHEALSYLTTPDPDL